MQNRIPIIIFLLSLWIFIQTISAFANEENVIQDNKGDTAVNEIMKTREEHSGLQRNLGFSNFLEGWFTPWDAYEENENLAPRVPLLRITPAFFKREVRFNYIYVDDEHKGEADVNEWGMALELPLTLRIKVDIEPKILYVNTEEHDKNSGFGDTKVALRTMLLESNIFSLSTGSVISIPTGEEERKLGEGITTVGQQLAFWMDMGHRISLHTFLGVDVPIGGEHREDANLDFLYGTALSKTFTIKEAPVLAGITLFMELNGQKEFGLDKDEQYRVDLMPGVRWDLSHELYVMQGIEIPLNGTGEFDKRVWFSIIKDF